MLLLTAVGVTHAEFTSGSAFDVIFTVQRAVLLGRNTRVLDVMVVTIPH
jgi:hypothetical protein